MADPLRVTGPEPAELVAWRLNALLAIIGVIVLVGIVLADRAGHRQDVSRLTERRERRAAGGHREGTSGSPGRGDTGAVPPLHTPPAPPEPVAAVAPVADPLEGSSEAAAPAADPV